MNHAKASAAGGKTGKDGLIFLVDDEPLILELGSAILRPLGYKILTFRNPLSALEAFGRAEPRPNLVITDFAMPGIDGLRLLEKCRRLSPGQKVLMVSGTVEESYFTDAPVKPDRFLAKPFQPAQLVEVVRSLIQ
jgi:CheY-like chemotaxis protein